MKRMALAFFLSLCIHLALLYMLAWDEHRTAPREQMRVSLQTTWAKAEETTVSKLPVGDEGLPSPAETPNTPPTPPLQVTPDSAEIIRQEKRVAKEMKKSPAPVVQPTKQTSETKTAAAKLQTPPRQKKQEVLKESPPPTPDTPLLRRQTGMPGRAPSIGDSVETQAARAPGSNVGTRSAQPSTIVEAASLKVVKKKIPEYPMISRKRKEQGVVVLLIRIESGRVANAEVERSSGHQALDESAKRAARNWRFDTTDFGDTLTARIPFSFTLK